MAMIFAWHNCSGYEDGGFFTVEGFIDCECGLLYRYDESRKCPNCGTPCDDSPDARLEDLLTDEKKHFTDAELLEVIAVSEEKDYYRELLISHSYLPKEE